MGWWERDKTLIVLCGGLLFFAGMVMIVVYTDGDDIELYGLFAAVFSQFSGALMMHLKTEHSKQSQVQVSTSTESGPLGDKTEKIVQTELK